VSNQYSVVIDSNILAQNFKQIIVLALANAQLFRPIWSETILEEASAAITKRGGDGAKYVGYLKELYPSALADSGYIHLVRNIQLADEGDRHVVAVALQEHADAICTDNLRDFQLSSVDVLSCDQLVLGTIDLSPMRALEALAATRLKLKSLDSGSAFVRLMEERELTMAAEYLKQYSDRL